MDIVSQTLCLFFRLPGQVSSKSDGNDPATSNLTKMAVPWTRLESRTQAIKHVKDNATNTPVQTYYYLNEEATLEYSAVDHSIGSSLDQGEKPITFACR